MAGSFLRIYILIGFAEGDSDDLTSPDDPFADPEDFGDGDVAAHTPSPSTELSSEAACSIEAVYNSHPSPSESSSRDDPPVTRSRPDHGTTAIEVSQQSKLRSAPQQQATMTTTNTPTIEPDAQPPVLVPMPHSHRMQHEDGGIRLAGGPFSMRTPSLQSSEVSQELPPPYRVY